MYQIFTTQSIGRRVQNPGEKGVLHTFRTRKENHVEKIEPLTEEKWKRYQCKMCKKIPPRTGGEGRT